MLEISNSCSSTFTLKPSKISVLVYLVFISVQSQAQNQNQNKDHYCPQINLQELLDGYSRGQKGAVHFQ